MFPRPRETKADPCTAQKRPDGARVRGPCALCAGARRRRPERKGVVGGRRKRTIKLSFVSHLETRHHPSHITHDITPFTPSILVLYGTEKQAHGSRQQHGSTALKKKQASGPDSMSRLARAWALQLDAPPAPPLLPRTAC